jgi:hypothetical protein
MAKRAAAFFVEAAQVNPKLSIIEAIAADSTTKPSQGDWAQCVLGVAQPRGEFTRVIIEATQAMWGAFKSYSSQAARAEPWAGAWMR